MNVYYDKDADLSLIKDKKVPFWVMARRATLMPIICSDSGVTVTVGLRRMCFLGQGGEGRPDRQGSGGSRERKPMS